MQQDYNPGLHILSTIQAPVHTLTNSSACREFFNTTINALGLHKIGEVYHDFDNNSFTAVVCLTESHISIHTWPEHSLATFDVFLSNFNMDNTSKTRELYNKTLAFFEATETNKHEILR